VNQDLFEICWFFLEAGGSHTNGHTNSTQNNTRSKHEVQQTLLTIKHQ